MVIFAAVLENHIRVFWEQGKEKGKQCLDHFVLILGTVKISFHGAFATLSFFQVKIQKMRSNLEEKLMKRMAIVHRKAEEWRTTARLQHSEQVQKASEQARKLMMNRQNNPYLSGTNSCGCFPCNTHI